MTIRRGSKIGLELEFTFQTAPSDASDARAITRSGVGIQECKPELCRKKRRLSLQPVHTSRRPEPPLATVASHRRLPCHHAKLSRLRPTN